MSKINFTKMEGAGNDYVYIDMFKESLTEPENLAIELSDRHFGVGGDGMVLIAPSDIADVKMIMFNADGSRAEMCGNAIRCVGKYVWDRGLVRKNNITIETDTGDKELDLIINEANLVDFVKVAMGEPELQADLIPSVLTGSEIVDREFDFDGFSLKGTLVSMGNPHFVTFVDNVEKVKVEEWGKIIENSEYFLNRINVEFVQIVNRDKVIQRTWERGTGETYACGTGASAVCVAGVLNNITNSTITNKLLGGELKLTWEGKGHQVIMIGPAREVFSGSYLMPQRMVL
jgi:diaminopimelate epimerase